MGRVVPLHPRDHDEVRSLLPWYVSGRLDAAETARVTEHLATCAECRADLVVERRLKDAVAGQPVAVEDGWRRLRARIERESRQAAGPGASVLSSRPRRARALWGAFAIAASVAGVAVMLAAPPRTAPVAGYHALGAATASRAGNVVVIFRPDTPERDLRAALQDSGARLVGGPTDADAYILSVPQSRRAAVLATLRRRHEIVLAEPIDAGEGR
jgi:hypothetical protein